MDLLYNEIIPIYRGFNFVYLNKKLKYVTSKFRVPM